MRGRDPCQRRKENREMITPLGDVEEPKIPFEVTSMDITGRFPTTLPGNIYLLSSIDHLTMYMHFPFTIIGRNLCEGVLKPNRCSSWFSFDPHHGQRQKI